VTCAHCLGARDVFDRRTARRDLKRLRRRGPARATRRLLDALIDRDVRGAAVLDVGGGVGALQLGLLEAGAARALDVDASPAYQEAARSEAERRGFAERVAYVAGDLVELAPEIEPHELVTLDRVLCCYPDLDALVRLTAGRARRLWGAVLPRERWWIRLGVWAVNLGQALRRHPFRTFVHPVARMRRILADEGFEPVFSDETLVWQVWVFERRPRAESSSHKGSPS
jgi:magnesium-protoporphyrin O-methyltransferase